MYNKSYKKVLISVELHQIFINILQILTQFLVVFWRKFGFFVYFISLALEVGKFWQISLEFWTMLLKKME